MSVKDRLLSLVVRVIGLKRKPIEVEESRPQSASKCICVVSALPLSHFVRFGNMKKLLVISKRGVWKWTCDTMVGRVLLFYFYHHFSPACSSSESLNKLISETMVHWAQETEMENPELVRAVFSLLHRQYQGLGGQMAGPLCRAYTISQVSVEDTMALLSSLMQIRSLLSVRMGKEEERLMIRKLG